MEIMEAVSNLEYKLNMASLEDKANTSFRATLIIASTNMPKNRTQKIIDVTALDRRFDIDVTVDIKKEYKKELSSNEVYNGIRPNSTWPYALDRSKVSNDYFDPSVYIFRCNRTG